MPKRICRWVRHIDHVETADFVCPEVTRSQLSAHRHVMVALPQGTVPCAARTSAVVKTEPERRRPLTYGWRFSGLGFSFRW